MVLGLCSVSFAAVPDTFQFDTPAGPAEQAVREFSRQANLSVTYEPGSLNGFKIQQSLKGAYPWKQGLRRLLAGSGLDFDQSAENYFYVYPVPEITITRRYPHHHRSCICVAIPQAAWCWNEAAILEYAPTCR
jgi:iron complex outermembrane receptor protein